MHRTTLLRFLTTFSARGYVSRDGDTGRYRLGLQLLPSLPGEFHPEPLTDPDLTLSRQSGSCHRTQAAACH
jgi:hypothetical protein